MKRKNLSRFCILAILWMIGFAGCRKSEPIDAKDKNKDRIEAKSIRTLPASSISPLSYAKPAHWTQTRQEIIVNQNDENLSVRYSPTLRNSKYDSSDAYSQSVQFARTTSIAKGQSKGVEQIIYLPESVSQVSDDMQGFSNVARIAVEMQDRKLGTILGIQNQSVTLLEDYQTLFVVLAKNVDKQSFWQRLNVMRWPQGVSSSSVFGRPFIYVPINAYEIQTAFPTSLHGLSSTSTILLHDVTADNFSAEQQTAILDWLHYGGRLIIDGPSTIAGLANSFLSPYLPLDKLRNSAEGLDTSVVQLNQFSLAHATSRPPIATVPTDPSDTDAATQNNRPLDKVESNMISSSFCVAELRSESQWVPGCEGLLAERRIGEGRICMSTFDLSAPALSRWASYGNFIHTAIFRLPARRWIESTDEQNYVFAGDNYSMERSLETFSTLNRISTSHSTSPRGRSTERNKLDEDTQMQKQALAPKSEIVSGGFGWTSQSYFDQLAIGSLQILSGIKVPPIDYLTKILSVYLVVLVPLNWFVFRLFGKLEWAWLAMPAIAVGGAITFAKLLQIEIGFVRNQSSIGLLELQNNYARAPLARYVSLYTSLSTRFDASFNENQGCVLPVRVNTVERDSDRTVQYGLFDDRGSGIRGLPIRSHTAELFRSDEMVKLDGPLTLTRDKLNASDFTIRNETGLAIRHTIAARLDNGKIDYFWIGNLNDGKEVSSADVVSLPAESLRSQLADAMRDSLAVGPDGKREEDQTELRNQAIANGILHYLNTANGDRHSIAVCGWTKNVVSQLAMYPDPGQREDHTLVCLTIPIEKFASLQKDDMLPPLDMSSNFEIEEEIEQ